MARSKVSPAELSTPLGRSISTYVPTAGGSGAPIRLTVRRTAYAGARRGSRTKSRSASSSAESLSTSRAISRTACSSASFRHTSSRIAADVPVADEIGSFSRSTSLSTRPSNVSASSSNVAFSRVTERVPSGWRSRRRLALRCMPGGVVLFACGQAGGSPRRKENDVAQVNGRARVRYLSDQRHRARCCSRDEDAGVASEGEDQRQALRARSESLHADQDGRHQQGGQDHVFRLGSAEVHVFLAEREDGGSSLRAPWPRQGERRWNGRASKEILGLSDEGASVRYQRGVPGQTLPRNLGQRIGVRRAPARRAPRQSQWAGTGRQSSCRGGESSPGSEMTLKEPAGSPPSRV